MTNLLPDWTQFTLKEKIGQLIIVRASGYLFDHQIRYPVWETSNPQLSHWLETLNLGGVILLGGSAAELLLKTQQLQKWSKTPLFQINNLAPLHQLLLLRFVNEKIIEQTLS